MRNSEFMDFIQANRQPRRDTRRYSRGYPYRVGGRTYRQMPRTATRVPVQHTVPGAQRDEPLSQPVETPRMAHDPAEQVRTEAARNGAVDWQDKYTRLYADLDNTRKRLERNYAQQAAQQKEQLIRDLLPLADNLERSLNHANGSGDASLREGVELTLRAFLDTLNKHGVQPINAQGQPFDPALHEALGLVPHPTAPAGTVVHVEQTGYLLNDTLLRPARVLVVDG